MVWGHILLLTVVSMAAGFNIYKNPIKTYTRGEDVLFGQTMVQSKNGVLVASPNSKKLLSCDLSTCSEVDISASADDKGLKPIVSIANRLTEDTEKSMICQQVRKKQNMNEDFNGKCALLSRGHDAQVMSPATLVVDQMERNNNKNNNNNNNNNNDDDDEEEKDDPGTEIAFVLDGSGSISAPDFEIAKNFITNVMTNVWRKCFNCDFAVVQFGSEIRSELLLKESIENGTRAVEKVKNIKQIGAATVTASAIQYLLNYSFVPENGSKPDAKKIMIVVSDGQISLWDKKAHLAHSLHMLDEMDITRFAIGVGDEIKNRPDATAEMRSIAGSEENLFLVDDYKALDHILSQLETSIFGGIEGIKQGDGFKFQLSEAGFSNHMAPDGSLLFGAVGANDWSGGVILKRPGQDDVVFLQGPASGPGFSYLGYSVTSAVTSSGHLYISGAPRYNLTGGVFVFDAATHKQHQILQGDQVGSYFGSVLCSLDMDKNGMTDYLLIGAPSFFQSGEEGRVYVYRLDQGMFRKEDFEWQGVEKYVFGRFGSAIADVGDLDGDRYNDVAVGAPLENDEFSGSSGSIYIYNGALEGIHRHFSQRISAADFEMKLRHFGQSISAFSSNLDRNRQPYISVGSESKVTVLETIPVIAFKPRLSLSTKTIPLSLQTNTETMSVDMNICFTTTKGNIAAGEKLQVPYNIDLDVGQNKKRLHFNSQADREGNLTLLFDQDCLESTIHLSFMGCYDCFSPIMVRLNFSVHSPATGKPLRVLDVFTPHTSTEEIQFQKECAVPEKCVERISLSDSRLNLNHVIIGSTKSIAISFNLTNSGDGAYVTTLVLTYPNILQYSQLTSNSQNSQKIEGSACDNEMKETISQLRCRLLHPVFRRDAQANFTISWQLVDKKSEMLDAEINANLTCENRGSQVLDTKKYNFGIKNALKVQLAGKVSPNLVKVTDAVEKTEITFTFTLLGENKYNATIHVNISITMPAQHTDLEIIRVEPKDKCVTPLNAKVPRGVEYLIQCSVTDLQDIIVHADALISDVEGSHDTIAASGTVGFDMVQYELVNSIKMTSTKIEVMILKQEVVKSMAAIIGGSIGGFIVLAIFIVVLIKCGFFKRRNEQENLRRFSD